MSGFFGVTSKKDCVFDLFYGTDYHSHLGTRRGGMAVYGKSGFERAIHKFLTASRSPFWCARTWAITPSPPWGASTI